jgi:N-acetylmuramoyl-L-alanine amidase
MKRGIKYIAIHCTATQQNASVAAIQRYWKDSLGWKSPGYHLLIEPNGTINRLLDFNKVANGVKGFNNHSIHISYIGGITKEGKPLDNRTDAQKKAILLCINEVIEWSENKCLIIQGHRDFPNQNKACPCFDAKAEYRGIV